MLTEQERVWLTQCKENNIEGLKSLYDLYKEVVWKIALRMLTNTTDAEDVTQEVFIKLHKSCGQFRNESSLKTWIYRITVNLCYDKLRKRKFIHTVSVLPDMVINTLRSPSSEDPEHIHETTHEQEMMYSLLNKLNKKQRACIVLSEVEHRTYEEIAQILHCPIGTVRSRINRGKQILIQTAKEMGIYE